MRSISVRLIRSSHNSWLQLNTTIYKAGYRGHGLGSGAELIAVQYATYNIAHSNSNGPKT